MQNKNNVNPVTDESDQTAFVVADIKDHGGIHDIYVPPTLSHVREIIPGGRFCDSAPTNQGRFPLRMLLVRFAKLPLSDDAHGVIFAYCEDERQEKCFADCEEARTTQEFTAKDLRQWQKAKAKSAARGLGTGLTKRNRRISGGLEKPEAFFLAGGGGAGGEACVFSQFREKRERAALERCQRIIHQERLRDFFAMRFL